MPLVPEETLLPIDTPLLDAEVPIPIERPPKEELDDLPMVVELFDVAEEPILTPPPKFDPEDLPILTLPLAAL